MDRDPDEIRQEIEDTRARMGDTVEAIGYKADVKSRAKETIVEKKDSLVGSIKGAKDSIVGTVAGTKENVAGSMSDMKGSTMSTVSDRTPSTQDMKQGVKRAASVAQDNPLGLAVGSMALGFLAGMMLPSTRMEDERVGPLATQVKEKAMETGQEAMERGKQVAQEAVGAARDAAGEAMQKASESVKETAQQQGEELASSAQQKAQDVTGSGSMPAGGTGDLESTGPDSPPSSI
jgi:hypothetical protein